MDVVNSIQQYGFPIVATVGLVWVVYCIWKYITSKIKTKLGQANTTLIGLIDRIRVLANDIIRLQQKLDTVIELRELDNAKDKQKNAAGVATKQKQT